MKVFVIILTLGLFLWFLYGEIRKHLALKINTFVMEGKANKIEQILKKPMTGIFYSKKERLHLQLESSIIMKNDEKIDACLKKIVPENLPINRKTEVYFQLFDYYVQSANKEKAQYWLMNIQTLNDKQLIENAEIIYNVLVERNDVYLASLLKNLKNEKDYQRAFHEYLLSEIYTNKKNHKLAKKYLQLSQSHFEKLNEPS